MKGIWSDDGAIKERTCSPDFMFTFCPSNHVRPFEAKCKALFTNRRLEDICYTVWIIILSWWLSIRITLWFDLKVADDIAIRDHDPSQGYVLIT